jgi:hypothetical protein
MSAHHSRKRTRTSRQYVYNIHILCVLYTLHKQAMSVRSIKPSSILLLLGCLFSMHFVIRGTGDQGEIVLYICDATKQSVRLLFLEAGVFSPPLSQSRHDLSFLPLSSSTLTWHSRCATHRTLSSLAILNSWPHRSAKPLGYVMKLYHSRSTTHK